MQATEQELLQQRAVKTSLQTQVSEVPAEGARQTPAIDTRIDSRVLGKPDVLDGTASKWRDWKVVTLSHIAACHYVFSGLVTLNRGNTGTNPQRGAHTSFEHVKQANSSRSSS